jgi:hypothetical protein
MKHQFVAVAAIALAVSTFAPHGAAAQPVTGSVFKYSSPKTGHLNLHSMDFASDGANNNIINEAGNGLTAQNNSAGCANAGVHLPQSATVTGLTFWYKSGVPNPGDPATPIVHFLRTALATGNQDVIGTLSGNRTDEVRRSRTVPLDSSMTTIDNAAYWYSVSVCVTSVAIFYGLRITYTYTNAGD